MNTEERAKLNDAAMEVFGTMYFTPIELLEELPTGEEIAAHPGAYIKANISYSGLHQADIVFYFPLKLGENIAEGFLGVELSELPEGQVLDTMQEAANMIVGTFLGKIDPGGECSLGIPTSEVVDSFKLDGQDGDRVTLAFTTDFGYLWMLVD